MKCAHCSISEQQLEMGKNDEKSYLSSLMAFISLVRRANAIRLVVRANLFNDQIQEVLSVWRTLTKKNGERILNFHETNRYVMSKSTPTNPKEDQVIYCLTTDMFPRDLISQSLRSALKKHVQRIFWCPTKGVKIKTKNYRRAFLLSKHENKCKSIGNLMNKILKRENYFHNNNITLLLTVLLISKTNIFSECKFRITIES